MRPDPENKGIGSLRYIYCSYIGDIVYKMCIFINKLKIFRAVASAGRGVGATLDCPFHPS